jgi:hypothetical protein
MADFVRIRMGSHSSSLRNCSTSCCGGAEEQRQYICFWANGSILLRTLQKSLRHGGTCFLMLRSPDIMHAWTPCENVRRFCQQLDISRFNLIVHLEDNEEAIVKASLGGQFQKGAT